MGVMRFRVFPTERITAEMVQQAYLSGIDQTAWPVRTSVEGGELLLQRAVSDSANLHVPWLVEGYGPLTLISASLIERAEPYSLPLEIARGTIVQVRNQLADWQAIGLSVPETVHAKLASAIERFSWAAVEQEDLALSAPKAEEALRDALDAADLLAAAYTEQALAVRAVKNRQEILGPLGDAEKKVQIPFALLGADLGTTPPG